MRGVELVLLLLILSANIFWVYTWMVAFLEACAKIDEIHKKLFEDKK